MHNYSRKSQSGSVLIGVLFFILVTSIMLAGVGLFTVGHGSREYADQNYAESLDLAEAGVNYELNRLSAATTNADQYPGSTHTLGNGSFTVYCLTTASAHPWPTSNTTVLVYSVGTVDGVSRTVSATGTGGSGSGNAALYCIQTGNINGHVTVSGAVGTNGSLYINGSDPISNGLQLNGPAASAIVNPAGSQTITTSPTAIVWPTVDSFAAPLGGISYLSTHNDNATASPAIPANGIVNLNGSGNFTFTGKPGGANYYMTTCNLNGNWQMKFNNTAGPINIWFGPDGTSGVMNVNGGNASIKMSTDPTKAVKIYIAGGSANLNGNTELDAGVYVYNGSSGGIVNFNGSGNIYGQVICNSASINGSPAITYTTGYFAAGSSTWKFGGAWNEVSPR